MSYSDYQCLKIRSKQGVAFVTIDHPPINLFDMALIAEMDRVGRELEADSDVRAVVVHSADPDLFIAHADVELILSMPAEAPEKTDALGVFQQMVDRFRTMPKATIAVIEGICRGGGSELALSMDMRFAAQGKALLGQPEVMVGIIPGGSGAGRDAGAGGGSAPLFGVRRHPGSARPDAGLPGRRRPDPRSGSPRLHTARIDRRMNEGSPRGRRTRRTD